MDSRRVSEDNDNLWMGNPKIFRFVSRFKIMKNIPSDGRENGSFKFQLGFPNSAILALAHAKMALHSVRRQFTGSDGEAEAEAEVEAEAEAEVKAVETK